MGNAGSAGGLSVSPEDLQALLVETGLDKATVLSLADVFLPADAKRPTQNKSVPPSPFARLTLRRKGTPAAEVVTFDSLCFSNKS